MPEVLIRCPVTGKDVHTGLILHAEVLLNARIETFPVACPHCGTEHPWTQEEAYLQFPGEREPAAERRMH